MSESEYVRKLEIIVKELFDVEKKDVTSKINKQLKTMGNEIFGHNYEKEKYKFINNQAKFPILFSFSKTQGR